MISGVTNRAKAHSGHEHALRDLIRRDFSQGRGDSEEGDGQHHAMFLCQRLHIIKYEWLYMPAKQDIFASASVNSIGVGIINFIVTCWRMFSITTLFTLAATDTHSHTT